MIELHKAYPGVEFFGQDDKAKLAVGDEVAISAGVRPNKKSIVAIGDDDRLQAMDHDFHYANIIPSVTLRCNIPGEISRDLFLLEIMSLVQVRFL